MSGHQESHGSHGGGGMAWMETHLAGFVLPFGQAFERFMDWTMFLAVNGIYLRIAVIYLAVFTPILFLEFVFRFLGL
jgi:hypothetical protein